MGASGLRSSCESIPRNSSFRRLASRSACSARSRSVTSRTSDRTEATSPFASLTVELYHSQ